MASWFLGPKAENAESEQRMLTYILDDYFHWRRNYFPSDEILITQSMQREALDWMGGARTSGLCQVARYGAVLGLIPLPPPRKPVKQRRLRSGRWIAIRIVR
jgi:hypothetical protein